MSESNKYNPYLESNAKKPNEKVTREDCYWSGREEDVLYDAYIILREAGYSENEIEPLGQLIERTTIYKIENMEDLFDWMVKNRE